MDTNNLGAIHEEAMALDFNKNASEYYSETGVQQKALWKKKFEEAAKTGSNNINISMGIVKKVTDETILMFPQQKKMFLVKDFKKDTYEIPEQLPDLKWKIQRDTKTIKGYKCQLATGYWRGRIYNAWFTTDLPYPFGPWKLNGLPGAILEAADETNTVRFECDSIKKNVEVAVNLPKNAILTSQKEFDRMEQSMKNVNRQLSSENSDVTVKVEQVSGPGKGDKNKKHPTFNNPIELKEQ